MTRNQMTPVDLSGGWHLLRIGRSKNAKRKPEYREKIPDGITQVL